MPRKERYQEAGHYHIINRGVERRAIYLEPEDYEFFLDLLLKKKGVRHSFKTFLN
jgi:hypothetical protein